MGQCLGKRPAAAAEEIPVTAVTSASAPAPASSSAPAPTATTTTPTEVAPKKSEPAKQEAAKPEPATAPAVPIKVEPTVTPTEEPASAPAVPSKDDEIVTTAPLDETDTTTTTTTTTSAATDAADGVNPWEVMVQSHQALFFALDGLAKSTELGREAMPQIRAEADRLFALMKLHARIEDAVYFPAVEARHADVTSRFSDDHKRSGEGRPALLALLDAAPENDEKFDEAMAALRKFCAGNRAHQLAEEEVINPLLPTTFTRDEAIDVVRRIAALDPASWNTTYVGGVMARVADPQRHAFLRALKLAVPPEQYAEIAATARDLVQRPDALLVPSASPESFLST